MEKVRGLTMDTSILMNEEEEGLVVIILTCLDGEREGGREYGLFVCLFVRQGDIL